MGSAVAPRRTRPTGAPSRSRRPAPLASSDASGPFEVVQQIGAGSLGPTYSALQPEIDCLVAVKHFHLGLPIEHTQRVLKQFDALIPVRLEHLAIAGALGTGICDGSVYLIQ